MDQEQITFRWRKTKVRSPGLAEYPPTDVKGVIQQLQTVISSAMIDAFLASCRKCLPESRPIQEVELREIVNSEVIDDMSSDSLPAWKNSASRFSWLPLDGKAS
jgi:hypothetical protein